MSDTKYTVTFRMARMGDTYDNPDDKKPSHKSIAGHVWYELHQNGEFVRSAGFQSRYDEISGDGKITPSDKRSYINSPTSVTIQINEQQFNTLNRFGEPGDNGEGANAKAMGFDTSKYNGLDNNCVTYVAKALELIGYKLHLPSYEYTWPVNAIRYIREVLSENKAIGVVGNKLLPVQYLYLPESVEDAYRVPDTSKVRNYKITGYDGNSDEIHGGDGNDILIGKGGDDKLYGGRGNDVLYGDYTTDSASSSSSSSTFSTGYTADNNRTFSTSSDSSSSSSSSASSSSNESSNSSGNNDILNGGAGNDILNGGKGYDKYYIGDKDVIIDSDGLGEIHFLNKVYQVRSETESSSKHIITGYDEERKRLPTSFVYKENDKVIYRFEAEGASFVSAKSLGKTAYELQSH